ncbi:MAG TPA: glycosyltransferase family 1 protein [Aquabacterium sp.]|uniref:glycosyltransferase family 4 protein n=1 Tax=Aquabacterium sp. TaxID=1872578 RepID=UPI002E34D0EB|nr:glycosyltransferase family 1 protein [Aquabacterium sp.]HEX5373349.1 glycosyltransferase family 1 protein [Aquabacterium sp.]
MSHTFTIGVDFHTWDGIFQGARSHVLGLYKAAIRQAPDIRFVFFLEDTASLRAQHPEFSLPNVELVVMGHGSGTKRLALQLPWLRWRHGVDILHTQYRVPLIPMGKTACTLHDVLVESHPQFFTPSFVRAFKLTSRMAIRMASALFTVSEFSRSQLALLGARDVAVTYNAVDTSRFYPGDDGADLVRAQGLTPGQYIATIGRLEPRKNHVSLVQAWDRLGPDAPPLVIVGQRDFSFDEVFKAIAKVARPDKVHVLEKVDDRSLPAVMRHAALFVYPAFAEGFGMPVAEAMASGVPVITSNTTSLPEVAGDGAVLVDPADVASIHAGMARVLADAALRAELVRRASLQVTRFNWESSAQVLLSRMRQVMGEA